MVVVMIRLMFNALFLNIALYLIHEKILNLKLKIRDTIAKCHYLCDVTFLSTPIVILRNCLAVRKKFMCKETFLLKLICNRIEKSLIQRLYHYF